MYGIPSQLGLNVSQVWTGPYGEARGGGVTGREDLVDEEEVEDQQQIHVHGRAMKSIHRLLFKSETRWYLSTKKKLHKQVFHVPNNLGKLL